MNNIQDAIERAKQLFKKYEEKPQNIKIRYRHFIKTFMNAIDVLDKCLKEENLLSTEKKLIQNLKISNTRSLLRNLKDLKGIQEDD